MSTFKYGRLPRKHNSNIAHMSALAASKPLPEPPVVVDWSHGLKDFGMMLNDQLGDCSCAGIYHAIQVWSTNTAREKTEQDSTVLKLYEEACGYKPHDPKTDNGGVLQDVLMHCMNIGIPMDDNKSEKILGFIEVDPRNIKDVKIAINDFGLAYIGFNVPNSIFDKNGLPKPVWKTTKNDLGMDGGHCVILIGYDEKYLTVVSWGRTYKMSLSFFQKYCDEVYAIISPEWIDRFGKMPLGLTTKELQDLMAHIKK